MPTTNVGPGSALELQCIADIMGKSKKVVVITGAGISTNCGIPDFRSENGLYSLIQAQYDAALKDPSAYTEEIDDRPTKRRRVTDRWTYVTVKADTGEVVTDPSLVLPPPSTTSRSQSSNENSSEETTPAPTNTSDSEATHNPSLGPQQPRRSLRSQISNVVSPDEGDHSNTRSFSSGNNQPSLRRISQRQSSTAACQPLPKVPSTTIPNTSASQRSSSPQDPEDQHLPPRHFGRGTSQQPTEFASIPGHNLDSSVASQTELISGTYQDTSDPQPSSPLSSLPSSPLSEQSFLIQSIENQTQATNSSTQSALAQPLFQREESSILAQEPDEPSSQLSSSQTSRTSLPNLKGKDLFDSMVWTDPFTTSVFYRFISTLRQKVKEDVTTTTESHKFIKTLRDAGRLVRNYTQNIDCLEERLGLSTELEMGTGDRTRFSSKLQKQSSADGISRGVDKHGGVEVVQLHGSLVSLRCGICSKTTSWDDADRESVTMAGQAPDCPSCEETNARRTGRGRRSLAVGRLRPDIVLYGEEHPKAHLIAPLVTHDLGLGPDVLLILGTSLRVHGLKVMVKEFAKAVHSRGGKVIFINQTKPSESVWGDVIDFWVAWDCDEWVLDLKQRREDIWLPQGAMVEQKAKRQSSGEKALDTKRPSRPSATRDCKLNGAHITFKILETLGNILGPDGQPAARVRRLNQKFATDSALSTKPKPHKKKAPVQPTSALPKVTMNRKRPAQPAAVRDDKQNGAYLVSEIITKLRRNSESITPLFSRELLAREALASLSTNSSRPAATSYKDFNFSMTTNILPGLTWPLEKMNLLTHPPNTTGARISSSTNIEAHKKDLYNTLSPVQNKTVPRYSSSASAENDNKRAYSTRYSRSSQHQDDVGKQRLASLKSIGIKTMELASAQDNHATVPSLNSARSNRSSRRSSYTPGTTIPDTDDVPRVRTGRASDQCRSKRIACRHLSIASKAPSLLPQYASTHDSTTISTPTPEEVARLPKPTTRSRTLDATQLQAAVDAQLLLEAMAPKPPKPRRVSSIPGFTACKECRSRKRRCHPNHRPSLPTPSSSWSSSSDADAIVVSVSQVSQQLPTPDNSSDPLTPSAQRIKNMGKIGAVLSSPMRSLRSRTRSDLCSGIK